MQRKQGIFWLLTLPFESWESPLELPEFCQYIKGQAELSQTGYKHWQVCLALKAKKTLNQLKQFFNFTGFHAELTKSTAAFAYVWKEETRIPGTQFQFGIQPIQRNSKTDWEHVWTAATNGDLAKIPANIRVVSYRTLRAIAADHDKALPMERVCNVYWGPTGTGKSRRAWDEAGMDAYSKDPRTKFWCGYQNEQNVVIDEFRGGIDISHLLRWLDRYPVRIEIKGSSKPLVSTSFWITSNLSPNDWYPDTDHLTQSALIRRLNVIEFTPEGASGGATH